MVSRLLAGSVACGRIYSLETPSLLGESTLNSCLEISERC